MTIYEIKKQTEKTSPYFFSKETLKFFGQKMKSFKVRKLNEKLIGQTQRIFNVDSKKLEPVSFLEI